MKKKKNIRRFGNSFLANKIPMIIAALLLITLLSFLIIYNSYEEAFKIDIDGYMIGNSNLDQLKIEKEPEEEEKITTVNVKSEETIMKNSFNHYISNENRNTVNVNYPLYVNDGLTIVNYNDNINLLDSNFERTTGFSNLVLSYGKIYDNVSYTQLDQENYLFLSYQDGILINLYDIRIDTVLNTYTIPVNSFVYFFENQVNYLSREEHGFVRKVINDVDLNSKVTFFYLGGDESYEYTYEEVITLTGSVYIQEEAPPKPIEPEPEPEPVPKPKPVKPSNPKPRPQVKPERPPQPPAEKYWAKPEVTASNFTSQVYAMEGKIEINDPAGVIVKKPTFTLYVNDKVSTRRTFYQTSDIVITGLSAETEYVIVGTYTYMDSDWETKKVVTFFTQTISTKDRGDLEKIAVAYQNGAVYPRKMELKSLKITSKLDSEAMRGVKKVGIRVAEETFILNTKLTQSLMKGEQVSVISNDILNSNQKVNFEILFFDKDNNIIEAENNKGITKTCKNMPTLFLKIVENDNINMKVHLNLRNDDKVELKNYRYVLVDITQKVIQYGDVEGEYVEVTDLDADKLFTLQIYADMDLEDGNGTIKDVKLKEIDLITLPISSLGQIHMKTSVADVTDTSASLKVEMNHNRTDSRLVKLLRSITVKIYEKKTGILVATEVLQGSDLDLIKERKSKNLEFKGLTSFTEYKVEISSLVIQGSSNYELSCVLPETIIYTRRKPVEVSVINMFANNEMIDFDIAVIDKDGAILTGEIVVELRDRKNSLIKTLLVKTTKDSNPEYTRITYNNLEANQTYKLNFYADEYNETHKQIDYKSKHQLKNLTLTTTPGISGTIDPISSQRITRGNNLIDIHSEIKWYQTEQWYNIPKTVDENGGLHLYSKTSTADYAYDLSEYQGKRVTVSFTIRNLTPHLTNRRIWVTNYLGGTSTWNYNTEIKDISSNPTPVEFTFTVGSYRNDETDTRKVVCTAYHNGKNRCNFLTFYITGGNSELAEFVIEDLMAYVSEDVDTEFKPQLELEQGYYESNKNRKVSDLDVRTKDYIELEAGSYYQFNYNTERGTIYFYDAVTEKHITSISDVVSGQTYKPSKNMKILAYFRNPSSPDKLSPEQVEFQIKKSKPSSRAIFYEEFKYALETKIKLNLVDLRNEINNDRYYIRIYENGEEVTCPNDEAITGITNSAVAPCYVYTGKDNVKDLIHEIDLKEGKDYVVELAVYINNRFYGLATFEMSTENEVKGISTIEDWAFIQPRGHYILLNDLSFEKYYGERIGYGYRYFYGVIDFQGHSVSTYSTATNSSDTNGLAIIGRVERTGVLKNMVLNVHQDNTTRTTVSTGFVTYNYGTIENVQVNFIDETPENLENQYISPLVTTNYVGATIRNFVVNVVNETNLYSHSSLLCRTNYGNIENGYIYGENINIDPKYSSNDSNLGLIQVYGGVRSKVKGVYVLPSMIHQATSDAISGLVSYETYGVVDGVITIGDSNAKKSSVGPAVGYVRATASLNNVYYYNKKIYTHTSQQKTTSTALNDIAFQKEVLGNGFNVEEMVKIGYYPHVKYTTAKMPQQPYLQLPEKTDKKAVDIISMKVISKTMTEAQVEFSISNPEGADIRDIQITGLDCTINFQNFEEGTTIVRATLSNPEYYYSRYNVYSITSSSSGYESTRTYTNGEKYANVEFFKEIRTAKEWQDINNNKNQNYALMNDISFYGNSNFYISSYSGVLEGNGYKLMDIDINKSDANGIFNSISGTLRNITFENVTKKADTTYHGIIGTSSTTAILNNVHVKNIKITIPSTSKKTAIYAGGLVGQSSDSKFQNCSVTNVTIESDAVTSGIAIGGLIGRTVGGNVTSNFVRNVNIKVDKSIGVTGVGGLIGSAEDGSNGSGDTIIINAYTTGKIVSNNIYVGGLVGRCNGTIDTSYSTVNVGSDLGYVGGLVGFSGTDASGYNKNIYFGNVYTPKNGDKLIPNKELGVTNYTLADSLVNGVETTKAYGGTVLERSKYKIIETYTETIEFGEGFDYSQVTSGVLPKLYALDTQVLLPNQTEDIILPTENLKIKALEVDYSRNQAGELNKAAIATITFEDIPTELKVTGLTIEGAIVTNVTQNGTTTVIAEFEPERYYDYYKLSAIEITRNGTTKETQDKQNIIPIQFFKTITKESEWDEIDSNYPENYYLAIDIDLSKVEKKTNLIVNRLIGLETVDDKGQPRKHEIKGLNMSYTNDRTGVCVFEKIISKIENIKFYDITIKDTSSGGNSYVNIIRYNYGDIEKLEFDKITLDAKKEDYVGPIGVNYGYKTEQIKLSNITISGDDTVAGFIAYAENGEDRTYSFIDGTNINVTSQSHRAGGVFGCMRDSNAEARYLIHDINIDASHIKGTSSSSTHIGGITGYGDCTRYCKVKNTTIEGERYVGGIVGYQLSRYSRDNEVYDIHIISDHNNGYRVGGIGGYTRDIFKSYVINSTIEFRAPNSYGLGGITGYRDGYYFRSNGVTGSTIGGNGTEIGGLIGRQSGGETHTSYVQDCTISGRTMVGGAIGTHRSNWVYFGHITRTKVIATESYAGGLVGRLGSSETSHGYIREMIASDMTVHSKKYAGGLFGGLFYTLYYPNTVYSLYFEGNITSDDSETVGLATGDEHNTEILPLNRIVFYEDTTINTVKAKAYAVAPGYKENMLKNTTIVKEHYLGSKGEEVYNRSYPNAGYIKEFIRLKANTTYTVGVNAKSGTDWMRVKVYDIDGSFIQDLTTASTNYYPRAYNFARQTQVTFRIFRDCLIKVMYYNMDQLDSYYLYETTYGNNSVNTEQLVNYQDLTNRVTWTRYGTYGSYDHAYTSKLNLTNDRFDFTRVYSEISDFSTTDKSGNNIPVTGKVTSILNKGLFFDRQDDTLLVDNSFVQPSTAFTVSARIRQISTSPQNYEFIYLANDPYSGTKNGFGIFTHYSSANRLIYIRVNGTNYSTGLYVPLNASTEITATYGLESNKKYSLKVYINGVLRWSKDNLSTAVTILNTSTTKISPLRYDSGSQLSTFSGICEYIAVYDKVLDETLIKTNYTTTNWNKTNLKLLYDFRNMDTSGIYNPNASYPTLKDPSFNGEAQLYQEKLPVEYDELQKSRLTPLPHPTFNVRPYLTANLSTVTTANATVDPELLGGKILMLDKSLKEIYKVYPSGVNKLNIEFDKQYANVTFKYKNGDYESEKMDLIDRTFTINYDYKNDLIITLATPTDSEEIVLTSKELAKAIEIIGKDFYHITNNKLYKNDKKIADKAYNIYNGSVLLDNNQLYDIATNQTYEFVPNIGISPSPTPLAEYNVQDRKVETFYNYSVITDLEGNVAIRNAQIHVKDNKIYIFDEDKYIKQDMNIFNVFNTSEYQISLVEGYLLSIKTGINYPSYFSNNNIEEIDQDINSKESIMMVRYKNDYIVAFDYYTGKELFTYGTKEKISLLSYIGNSMSGEYILSTTTSSYKETAKLKEQVDNITDKEIQQELSKPLVSPKEDDMINMEPVEDQSNENGVKVETVKPADDFVQVYNNQTGEYEVYSTNDILDATSPVLETTSNKIYKNDFLYKYFQGQQKNTFFERTKVIIIATIIGLVILNLALFIKNINTKEVKKNENVKAN